MKGVINGLDLFSGIGGFFLGLRGAFERVGVSYRALAYVESDPICQAILKARMLDGLYTWGNIYDEIREFDGTEWRGKADIITAGWPCQDISVAGRGAGLAGLRSGLFYELWRIVREARPPIVIMENSPAIRTRGLLEIIRVAASSGYTLRWNRLSARSLGSRFYRTRFFGIAYDNSLRESQPKGHEQEIWRRDNNSNKENRETINSDRIRCYSRIKSAEQIEEENCEFSSSDQITANSNCKRLAQWKGHTCLHKTPFASPVCGNWWTVEPKVGRLVAGFPNRDHRIRALGNAVVPQVVMELAMRTLIKTKGESH